MPDLELDRPPSKKKLELFRELMGTNVKPSDLGPLEAHAGSRLALVSPLLGYSSYTTSRVRQYPAYLFFVGRSQGLMARKYGRIIEYEPGRLYTNPPFEPMQELVVTAHPAYDCIIFAKDFVQSKASPFANLLTPGTLAIGTSFQLDPVLNVYLKEFRSESSSPRTPTRVLQALELLILEKLSRSYLHPEHEEGRVASESGIEKAVSFIDAHPALSSDVDELARKAGMSRRTFFEKFRRFTQASPGEYIRAKRLLQARQLMEANREASLGDIAYACGFSSQTYFSRLWKATFGEVPSRSRNASGK
jgi:AraC-like DNA-binding protein